MPKITRITSLHTRTSLSYFVLAKPQHKVTQQHLASLLCILCMDGSPCPQKTTEESGSLRTKAKEGAARHASVIIQKVKQPC